jgi:hypothetical protein
MIIYIIDKWMNDPTIFLSYLPFFLSYAIMFSFLIFFMCFILFNSDLAICVLQGG